MPRKTTPFFKIPYGWDSGEDPGVVDLDTFRQILEFVMLRGFAVDTVATTGLTLVLQPGVVRAVSLAFVKVTPPPVTLTANAVNYIERDTYGTIYKNTAGWTVGGTRLPVCKLTTDAAGIVPGTFEDWRPVAEAGILVPGPKPRTAVSVTTALLAAGANEVGFLTFTPSFALLRITCTSPARVRLYRTTAQRDADVSRIVTIDPIGNHGLEAEVLTVPLNLVIDMAPAAIGGGVSSSPTVYYTITNTDLVAQTITVTFDILPLE